jgi:hypothetical protein
MEEFCLTCKHDNTFLKYNNCVISLKNSISRIRLSVCTNSLLVLPKFYFTGNEWTFLLSKLRNYTRSDSCYKYWLHCLSFWNHEWNHQDQGGTSGLLYVWSAEKYEEVREVQEVRRSTRSNEVRLFPLDQNTVQFSDIDIIKIIYLFLLFSNA